MNETQISLADRVFYLVQDVLDEGLSVEKIRESVDDAIEQWLDED